MLKSHPALIGLFAAASLFLAMQPAQAGRPIKPKPMDCKGFIHGNAGKALSQSKAKKRGRRKWETRALFQAGVKYDDWAHADFRHYDCHKKGKWHHCQAAAYPCPKIRQAISGK